MLLDIYLHELAQVMVAVGRQLWSSRMTPISGTLPP